MKKSDALVVLLVVLVAVWAVYLISGLIYDIKTREQYIKMAETRADVNKNGKLEDTEVMDVYKTLDYDGEKVLGMIWMNSEQTILIANLAQQKVNEGRVAEFLNKNVFLLTDPTYKKDGFSEELLRELVDSDRDQKISFEEAAAAFHELCSLAAFQFQSCSFRLDHLGPKSGLVDFLLNPWNLTHDSELQRYATGQ